MKIKLSQGQPKLCWGGKSQTMMYAYPYTLARRAVVATMDLSARNLHLLETDHWLADRRNVEQVWLQAPVFPSHGPTATQPLEAMRRWSVADVSAFFESKDAVGLATTLSANSVQGKDLLMFTADDLVADLRMTRFGARKALALRDAVLRG